MASTPLQEQSRTVGWLLQKRLWPVKYYLAGIRGRSSLRRVDRWSAQNDRCGQLQNPVHAAQGDEQLERGEHWPREGADEAWPNVSRGTNSFRAAEGRKVRDLRLRESARRRLERGDWRSSFARTTKPGSSFRASLRGIAKLLSGGWQVPRRMRPDRSAWKS